MKANTHSNGVGSKTDQPETKDDPIDPDEVQKYWLLVAANQNGTLLCTLPAKDQRQATELMAKCLVDAVSEGCCGGQLPTYTTVMELTPDVTTDLKRLLECNDPTGVKRVELFSV